MRQPVLSNERDELSLEVSAWIAGLGLFTMTVLGTIALFYLLPMGTVQGDGAATLLAPDAIPQHDASPACQYLPHVRRL